MISRIHHLCYARYLSPYRRGRSTGTEVQHDRIHSRPPLKQPKPTLTKDNHKYLPALPYPPRLKNLLTNPPAIFLANPPEYIALDARFSAWLNLSQRENANVFVIVKTSAITTPPPPPAMESANPSSHTQTYPHPAPSLHSPFPYPTRPRASSGRPTKHSETNKQAKDSPTKLNQIGLLSFTIATTASATHKHGCTYSAIQKKRLSVAFPTLAAPEPEPSELPLPLLLSNTQCELPVPVSTSFHHRSPTRRRPAMFFE